MTQQSSPLNSRLMNSQEEPHVNSHIQTSFESPPPPPLPSSNRGPRNNNQFGVNVQNSRGYYPQQGNRGGTNFNYSPSAATIAAVELLSNYSKNMGIMTKRIISMYFICDLVVLLMKERSAKLCIYFLLFFGGTLLDLLVLNDIYLFNSRVSSSSLFAKDLVDQITSQKGKDILGIASSSFPQEQSYTLTQFISSCVATLLMCYRLFRLYSVAKMWYPNFKLVSLHSFYELPPYQDLDEIDFFHDSLNNTKVTSLHFKSILKAFTSPISFNSRYFKQSKTESSFEGVKKSEQSNPKGNLFIEQTVKAQRIQEQIEEKEPKKCINVVDFVRAEKESQQPVIEKEAGKQEFENQTNKQKNIDPDQEKPNLIKLDHINQLNQHSFNINHQLPQQINISNQLPQQININHQLGQQINIKRQLPQQINNNQQLPQQTNIHHTLPLYTNINQQLSPQSNINQQLPPQALSEVKQEIKKHVAQIDNNLIDNINIIKNEHIQNKETKTNKMISFHNSMHNTNKNVLKKVEINLKDKSTQLDHQKLVQNEKQNIFTSFKAQPLQTDLPLFNTQIPKQKVRQFTNRDNSLVILGDKQARSIHSIIPKETALKINKVNPTLNRSINSTINMKRMEMQSQRAKVKKLQTQFERKFISPGGQDEFNKQILNNQQNGLELQISNFRAPISELHIHKNTLQKQNKDSSNEQELQNKLNPIITEQKNTNWIEEQLTYNKNNKQNENISFRRLLFHEDDDSECSFKSNNYSNKSLIKQNNSLVYPSNIPPSLLNEEIQQQDRHNLNSVNSSKNNYFDQTESEGDHLFEVYNTQISPSNQLLQVLNLPFTQTKQNKELYIVNNKLIREEKQTESNLFQNINLTRKQQSNISHIPNLLFQIPQKYIKIETKRLYFSNNFQKNE